MAPESPHQPPLMSERGDGITIQQTAAGPSSTRNTSLWVHPWQRPDQPPSPTPSEKMLDFLPEVSQLPYPPRDQESQQQRPNTPLLTRITLLLVVILPLLIIPAYCTIVLLGLWIPESWGIPVNVMQTAAATPSTPLVVPPTASPAASPTISPAQPPTTSPTTPPVTPATTSAVISPSLSASLLPPIEGVLVKDSTPPQAIKKQSDEDLDCIYSSSIRHNW
ncbi:hypothetical protein FQN55_004198 [Onygenales sp. PD_40]|nr:hypothetical protein FQN55_004198 [Onygenales sp. PD_40]